MRMDATIWDVFSFPDFFLDEVLERRRGDTRLLQTRVAKTAYFDVTNRRYGVHKHFLRVRVRSVCFSVIIRCFISVFPWFYAYFTLRDVFVRVSRWNEPLFTF